MSADQIQPKFALPRRISLRRAMEVFALLMATQSSALASSVVRSLPAKFVPQTAFVVTNTVQPDGDVFVYAVQDSIPTGWTANNVSDDGAFIAASNTIAWGPFFDGLPRTLTYQVVPASAVAGEFSGFGEFNLSETVNISGPSNIVLAASAVSSVTSSMPVTFISGVPFVVVDTTSPASFVSAYAIQDQLPSGWSAANVSDGGEFDNVSGAVLWGPFYDNVARTLSYTAIPSTNASVNAVFSGTGDFDGLDVSIGGIRNLSQTNLSVGLATRSLSTNFTGGEWLHVSCVVAPVSNVTVYAVEDRPPLGWTVTNISADGSFNSQGNVVQWGPFFGNDPMTLTYDVLPPDGAGGTNYFAGAVEFGDESIPIIGISATIAAVVFSGSVECSMATNYTPGVPLTVIDAASPNSNILVYAVEDAVPVGWIVGNISDGGVFDSANSVVRWGPYFDNTTRSLTFQTISPSGFTGAAIFSGSASFDNAAVVIGGVRETFATPVFVGGVFCAMPSNFVAGVRFAVMDTATPATNTMVYAVEDTLPAGWIAMNVSDDGTFDAATSTVQWGPFFDSQTRALSYIAIPPAQATSLVTFSGTATFGGASVFIGGQRTATPAPPRASVVLFHAKLVNGQFQFDFTNATGSSAVLYATTNLSLPLSQWETLGAPQSLGGGLYRFIDAVPASHAQRYFQIH